MTKIWKLNPPSPLAVNLATKAGISTLEAQILINRGISDNESIKSFLTPQLSDLMDPMLLKDMDRALELIINTVDNQEKIAVYGDYDADGITGTAILLNFFSDLQIPISAYIPKRLEEGYSLNADAVKRLAEKGTKLIITVDCGISNQEEIKLAQSLGIKVVVTDHHQIPADFFPICPVINPHRKDSSFPFRKLAGVGVSFFLVIALRAVFRERGYFRDKSEPDLKYYLDLVALGTVADMVPLIDQNRIIVKSGIEMMKNTVWPGIKSMQESAGIDASSISSSDLAYRLAPRLNAPGRMGDSLSGLETLTTNSPSKAREMAELLSRMNSHRQVIEGEIIAQIEEKIIPHIDLKTRRTLLIFENNWHKGVLGIIASRLLNKYHRPTIVLTIQDGVATGSGRSIEGFNLYNALRNLEHLLVRYGGHYHAAGLTISEDNLDAFSNGFEELAKVELDIEDLIPSVEVDAEVSLVDINFNSVKQMDSLAPFGAGNPEPVFYAGHLQVLFSRVVGERHLKLKVGRGDRIIEAIGFNLAERHPLDGATIDLLFTPEIDSWNGHEKLQLRIIDLEITEKVQIKSRETGFYSPL